MTSFRFTYFALILGLLLGCVSSAEDLENARKVSAYLNATGVIPFNNKDAERTFVGKIAYMSPGTNGSPHFIFYEVKNEDEILRLKSAAERAIQSEKSIKKITLHFMEKQVLHRSDNGAIFRGKEKEISTIEVRRE